MSHLCLTQAYLNSKLTALFSFLLFLFQISPYFMTTASFSKHVFLIYWCCNCSLWWAFVLFETSVAWEVKCCICISSCQEILYWRFTKRPIWREQYLIHLFCHCISSVHVISSRYWHEHQHKVFLSWMLDFYWGYWKLCLVNDTMWPIDFKYFFILLSYRILMCLTSRHSTTANILSICIFDVRSNVFSVFINGHFCCK